MCNKVIKSGFEKHHLTFCKEKKCDFIHIDNVSCDAKSHKLKFHSNFYSYNQIVNVKTINQSVILQLKINLLKNKNNFIVFKCDSIQETLSSIQNEFHVEYRIIAKTCMCVSNLSFAIVF